MNSNKISKYFACMGLVAATLALPTAANATFINNGTYTTDTVSGMDWLKLSTTTGQSYDTVSASIAGGALIGWRYASALEVRTLISHAVGSMPADLTQTTYATTTLDSLVSLFGANSGDGNGAYATGITSTPLSGSFYEGISIRNLTNGATDRVFVGSQGAYNLAAGASHADVGSFLVRDLAPAAVPAPGTLLLLLPALLGLTGYSVRQRNKA